MEREHYLEMRKENKISIEVFYNFYCKKTKNTIPYIIFSQIFPLFFNQNSSTILQYFDSEFDIRVLLGKNGEEILIY